MTLNGKDVVLFDFRYHKQWFSVVSTIILNDCLIADVFNYMFVSTNLFEISFYIYSKLVSSQLCSAVYLKRIAKVNRIMSSINGFPEGQTERYDVLRFYLELKSPANTPEVLGFDKTPTVGLLKFSILGSHHDYAISKRVAGLM